MKKNRIKTIANAHMHSHVHASIGINSVLKAVRCPVIESVRFDYVLV